MRYALFFFCALNSSLFAKTVHFDMRDAGQRNIVHFVSDALIEKTIGISNAISGWVDLDPEKVSDGVKGEFEVDVRTFQTGVELRNEHVREKFLNSSEFPIATFTIAKVLNTSKTQLSENQPVTLRLEGSLKARGLQKTQVILVKALYFKESETTKQRLGGNLLKISASFDVDTAQYNITIPDAQKARFSRFVQVYVDAVGTDAPPGAVPQAETPKPNKDTKSR